MKKFMPYIKLGGSLLLLLVIYKAVFQPIVQKNATASKYLPSV